MDDGEVVGGNPRRLQPAADRGDDRTGRGDRAGEGEGDAVPWHDMGHERGAFSRGVDGRRRQGSRCVPPDPGWATGIEGDVSVGRLEDQRIGAAVVEEDRFHGAGRCGGGGAMPGGAENIDCRPRPGWRTAAGLPLRETRPSGIPPPAFLPAPARAYLAGATLIPGIGGRRCTTIITPPPGPPGPVAGDHCHAVPSR